MKKIIMMLCVLTMLFGCGGGEMRQELRTVDNIVNQQPDSALAMLKRLEAEKAHWGKSDRMRYELLKAKAMNKADSLFTSDSIMKEVVAYYDAHGSANDQMEAHYLLGCAYREKGEAPMALQCYQDAIDHADTTNVDCDYLQLSRVYGQMSELFYDQSLYKENIKYQKSAARYAWKAKDTLSALICYELQSLSYEQLHQTDSAIAIIENVSDLYKKYGYPTDAAIALGSITLTLTEKGDLAKAKRYFAQYESQSMLFDSIGNIEPKREVYYYHKGMLYYKEQKLDSAEFWFRKELLDGKDFNNQNAGALGLARVFQLRHQSDSANKYYEYAYAMNDSMYARQTTETIERMQAMYNYSRHQEIARQESERANHRAIVIWIMAILLLFLCSSGYIIYQRVSHRRQEAESKYMQSLQEIERAHRDIVKMRAYQDENKELIAEKEKFIQEQKDIQASLLRKANAHQLADKAIKESPIYKRFIRLSLVGQQPTKQEWEQLEEELFIVYPDFSKFMDDRRHLLNDKEFKTCLLIRIGIRPSDISNMLNTQASYISNIRLSMHKKLFDELGNTKEFDKKIQNIY